MFAFGRNLNFLRVFAPTDVPNRALEATIRGELKTTVSARDYYENLRIINAAIEPSPTVRNINTAN